MPLRSDLLDRRWMVALLAFAAAIPLLWPAIPPLVDLPGHMARFRIAQMGDAAPALAAAYAFDWRLVGNLALDLLIVPVGALFGIELGTKLVVLAVPALTVAGMLLVAREVHGRVPPAALFALPLAWPYPFHFGFINFSLSVGLAWIALWLWLRLSDRLGLRAAVFLPIGLLLWVAHMVGWGLFGLAAAGTELVRRRRAGEAWGRTLVGAAMSCLPLALPLIPMLLIREVSSGAGTFDWFRWDAKFFWVSSLLRDRWQLLDVASAWLLVLIAVIAAVRRRMDPMLAVPAALCLAAFVLMPRVAVGSAYADMRLLPFTIGLAVLAIRTPADWTGAVAVAGFGFFLLRLVAVTTSLILYDRSYREELPALDAIPQGASVLSLVVRPCQGAWASERLDHLPALVTIRRLGFTNDQWIVPGGSGLRVIKPGAAPYDRDPSQLVYPKHCRGEGSDLATAAAQFDRRAFDYVWVIHGGVTAPDLAPVWSNGRSVVYRVRRGE